MGEEGEDVQPTTYTVEVERTQTLRLTVREAGMDRAISAAIEMAVYGHVEPGAITTKTVTVTFIGEECN